MTIPNKTMRAKSWDKTATAAKFRRGCKTLLAIMTVALAFAATPAVAGYATATGSLNVRTGPSTHYRVVDVLYGGEHVTVHNCRRGWCRISHRGPDGWVSARYLSNTPHIGVRVQTHHHTHSHTRHWHAHPRVVAPGPAFNFEFHFGR